MSPTTRATMRPTVERHGPDLWAVRCPCQDGPLLWMQPWAVAKTWETAIALAHWHAELHAEQRCPTCLHQPPIAPPDVVDAKRGLIAHDGRLYVVVVGAGVTPLRAEETRT